MDNRKIYEQLQKEALDRYQTRFYKEGESPKALGWGGGRRSTRAISDYIKAQ